MKVDITRAVDILRHEGVGELFVKFRRWLAAGPLAGQPKEHKLILHALNDPGRTQVMIDVGAATGGTLSPFLQAGWTIHAFEPDPRNRATLERRFGGQPRLTICDKAVSNRDGASVPFYTSERSIGISSMIPFDTSHRQAGQVETISLRSYLVGHDIGSVDFLKVDTEGTDLLVLEGFPWESVRPEIVMCEFDDRKTQHLGYSYEDLGRYFRHRGYMVHVSEWYPQEKYGQDHRWRQFRTFPSPLAEDEAWGNLLATQGPEVLDVLQKHFDSFQKWHDRLARTRRFVAGHG